MRVITWNVNGIRARKEQLAQLLEQEDPDVLCVQEIKAAADQIPPELCELNGYSCYWHGQKGYSGVGLHVRRGLTPEAPVFSHPAFDYESRIVAADVGPLTVASVYVPNGGKDFPAKMRFLEQLADWSSTVLAAGRHLLVAGDLNVARTDMDVHPKERKKTAVGQLPEERALLERMLDGGLVDLARALHPGDDAFFTWWAPWRNLRERNIGWRIDFLLGSAGLAKSAVSLRSLREFGTSDHAPVVLDLDFMPISTQG